MISIINKVKTYIFMHRTRQWKIARKYGIDLRMVLNIPSAFITGSVGKTTTCRMLASILTASGKVVGLSTTQGVYLGNETVRVGDSANCQYASQLLIDKRLQAVVFELARGGLIQQGVAFDGCDVGAVLNVYDNHLGLDGVHTRESMADVKSLVIKSARKMAVINADDPLCLAMRDKVTAADTCLVSTHSDNPSIRDHLKAEGFATFLSNEKDPVIHFYKGDECIGAIAAADIPATYHGFFRPAVLNAMFAMAMAYGMGVEFKVIQDTLAAFQSNDVTNPGRMNFFEQLPFKVLFTCADGPQALAELAHFIKNLNHAGNKYLMFSSVGNRSNQFIKDMGKSVAGIFAHYICSDHDHLRGRPPGEAAALLGEGLTGEGVSRDQITIASSHQHALEISLNKPSASDLLVISSFAYDAVREEILSRIHSST